MAHLASVAAKVRQLVRRFAPVDRLWSGPHPDHAFFIRADMSPCCEYHDERFREQARRHSPPRPPPDDFSWSQAKRAYFTERLGGNLRDFPGPMR
jgi:hypothetical protein